MVFQMTPGTEAPAEMNTYFLEFKAMWMAENSTNTLHNLLTLRGAHVRTSQVGPATIAEMIALPPELDTFWPNRGYYGTCATTRGRSTSATWGGTTPIPPT